jgi:hypothetical protein
MRKVTQYDKIYLRGFLSALDFCISKKNVYEIKLLRRQFRKKAKKMGMVV